MISVWLAPGPVGAAPIKQGPSLSDSHLVNVRSAAVEAHQVAFAGVPPIVPPNQTGDAIDQPNDRLRAICGHSPSCCGSRRGSDTYSTLISNKNA
jgi:hypothetical protein